MDVQFKKLEIDTVTLHFMAMSGARSLLDSVVSSTVQNVIDNIQKNGGTFKDVKYGEKTHPMFSTDQVVNVIYEAPKIIFKNHCLISILRDSFKPRVEYKWRD